MRIDFTNFGVEPPDKGKVNRAGQPVESGSSPDATTTNSSSAAGQDQARFSFDPTRVQSLQAQVLAQPEIREAKVRPLQQAIDKGEYSVSASHVADALISELASRAQA
jgi:flagellar biosynthesis anti-sigma factor FlgM